MTTSWIGWLGGLHSPARRLASTLWRRMAMRNLSSNDNHQGLERLYALPDPWDMASAREQDRFQQTNDLIATLTGPVESMLEVGCGEGHQSQYLTQLCRRLDGVDVSQTAVARARQRVPQARFEVGSLTALPWQDAAAEGYDLVVACEVLYYVRDVPTAIQRMSQLGRSCLVTFFCPSARLVAEHLQGLHDLRRGWIYRDPYAWLWAYWKPRTPPSSASD